jgi:FtsH-binding integral membrane protein
MAQTPDQQPLQLGASQGVTAVGSTPLSRDQVRTVFGQVMGLVALTLGCLALGAYIGRDLSGGIGILFFLAGFACIFGLNIASARGRDQLATTLLFGLGLLLGLALGPVLNSYAKADPSALWQAAGATAAFVAILGTAGYAPAGTVLVVPGPVLGAAGAAGVRARRDLRLDPQRERDLVGRRARDLRRIHEP